MNSTRMLVAVLLGVAALGCIPDRSSIEFAGAFAPNLAEDTCTWDGQKGDVTLLQGQMNTAVARSYWLVVGLTNNLPAKAVSVGTTETSPATRNDFVIREAEFSYTCKDTQANCAGFRAPKPTIVQLAGFLKAGEEGAFLLPILTSEAAIAISDWATDVPATILVGMKFRGDYVSGSTGETDTINFPVVIYKIDPTPCAATQTTKLPTCPGVFGINGFDYYICENPATDTGT